MHTVEELKRRQSCERRIQQDRLHRERVSRVPERYGPNTVKSETAMPIYYHPLYCRSMKSVMVYMFLNA